jgi:hypothetical protein
MRRWTAFGLGVLVWGVAGGATNALTLGLSAIDSGFYNDLGDHVSTATSYIVGADPVRLDRRNFFVFDLSGVPAGEIVVSATLRLEMPVTGYLSPDPSETYVLHDVSMPIVTLRAGGIGVPGAFADLGSGAVYGTRALGSGDNGTLVEISLTPAAIADLNAALGGLIAIGGALTTLRGQFIDEFAFGSTFTGGEVRQLELVTTPEPSPIALLLGGLGGLAWARRRPPEMPRG